jgi:hypothetical protein
MWLNYSSRGKAYHYKECLEFGKFTNFEGTQVSFKLKTAMNVDELFLQKFYSQEVYGTRKIPH